MKVYFIFCLTIVLLMNGPAFSEGQDSGVGTVAENNLKAYPLPLDKVRLKGGPLKQAQDVTAEYLLQLEPDRMLAGYRIRAGLKPKAEGYGGCDRQPRWHRWPRTLRTLISGRDQIRGF